MSENCLCTVHMRIAKLNSIKFDQVYGEKISITATLNNGSIIPTRVRIAHVLFIFSSTFISIQGGKKMTKMVMETSLTRTHLYPLSMYKITQR
jgi:hypothetical protein